MTVQSARPGVFAFAKQSAIGTPAAAPDFAVPKSGGGIGPARDRADLPVTRASQGRAGQYVQRARAEAGALRVLGFPAPMGALLYQIMGAQTVSGAGPYLHTFTMADAFPTPMTVWDLVADQWFRFTDVFLTRMAILGVSGENVVCELGMVGFNGGPVSAPTYTLHDDTPRHKFIGSTVKLEADGASPVALDTAEEVALEIDRAPELRYGASLTPKHVVPVRNVSFRSALLYDPAQQGQDFLKAARLGAVAATEMGQDIESGSFEVTFGRHPIDATKYFKIASNADNWEYDMDRPESDPGGGVLTLAPAGVVKQPAAGGSEVTIELANDEAGLY